MINTTGVFKNEEEQACIYCKKHIHWTEYIDLENHLKTAEMKMRVYPDENNELQQKVERFHLLCELNHDK